MGPDDVEPWKLAACPLRPRLWGHVRPHCRARWTQNHSGPVSPVIYGQNGEPLTLRKWSPGCLVYSKMGNPEPFSSRCWVVLLDLLVENGVLYAQPKNNNYTQYTVQCWKCQSLFGAHTESRRILLQGGVLASCKTKMPGYVMRSICSMD